MTYVYFIENHDGSMIKIGISGTPMKRIEGLRRTAHKMYGNRNLSFIGVMLRNSRKEEGEIHSALHAHRVTGEWFTGSDEVRGHIESYRPRFVRLDSTPPIPSQNGRIWIKVDPEQWKRFRESTKKRGLILPRAISEMLERELARVGPKAAKEPA